MAENELLLKDLLGKWSALEDNMNEISVSLAVRICEILQDGERYSELDMFLKALPTEDVYSKNERIVRAQIAVAFKKRDYPLVYYLIERNTFQNGEDLIAIWDDAHYAESEEKRKKSLTPLMRYRLRQRFIPPASICPTRERKKARLPKMSRSVLQHWFDDNINNPYPSRRCREYLSKKTNLTTEQVQTWFTNARRRLHKDDHRNICCPSNRTPKNKTVSDDTARHLVRSSGLPPETNDKTNHVDNMDEEGSTTLSPDGVLPRLNKTSTTSEGQKRPSIAALQPLTIATAMASQSQSMSSNVHQPNHSSTFVDSYGPRLARTPSDLHDISTTVPRLELVQPSVSLSSNLFGCTTMPERFPPGVCCGIQEEAFDTQPREMPHGMLRYSRNPWFSLGSELDQSRCCCSGHCQIRRSSHGFTKGQLPDISTFRAVPTCARELLNCHQQTNSVKQGPSSQDYANAATARGVMCESPRQSVRYDAATALLDMSLKPRSWSTGSH